MNHRHWIDLIGRQRGLLYALIAVAAFSLTLPATRVAVTDFSPHVVGLGRVLIASVFALSLLLITGQPLPASRHWRALALVALGVGIGFPWLSAWAMSEMESSHGAVMLGLLPLSTALMARLRAGEHLSRRFWLTSVLGAGGVVVFALTRNNGAFAWGDLLLLLAVALAALGYAEGGRLAKQLGGWQTISWAVVLAAPVAAIPVGFVLVQQGLHASVEAWVSLGYVSLVTQWLAFFAWYQGMKLSGVARTGQIQLLQTFFTLGAAALWLHEQVPPSTYLFALWVAACVSLNRLSLPTPKLSLQGAQK